ncbi:hypothetical protein [Joostella sp.]|uniref:hypothetical protein n=1 Tax=Joostella sp. TaxID=2231138 RepID=UPI003A906D1D
MDTSSILLGAIIFIACLVPLVLLGIQIKKASRKLLIPILEEAKKNNSNISVHEMTSDVCFAMDEEQKILYYYRKSNTQEELKTIPLGEIDNSKTFIKRKNENRTTSTAYTNVNIELYNNANVVNTLVVFDIEESKQLIPEVMVAEKWNRLINSKL